MDKLFLTGRILERDQTQSGVTLMVIFSQVGKRESREGEGRHETINNLRNAEMKGELPEQTDLFWMPL